MNSIMIDVGEDIETIFRRKGIYYVVINQHNGNPIFKIFGDKDLGWDLTCGRKEFEKHFRLLKKNKNLAGMAMSSVPGSKY